MSPAFQVSDFISNTGITIGSIATNFNGLTNAVRADSVYYLDQNLRLAATSPCRSGIAGDGHERQSHLRPLRDLLPLRRRGESQRPRDLRRPARRHDLGLRYFPWRAGRAPSRFAIRSSDRCAWPKMRWGTSSCSGSRHGDWSWSRSRRSSIRSRHHDGRSADEASDPVSRRGRVASPTTCRARALWEAGKR